MFDMIEIGRRIANYRKEKGMTQMWLANQLGVSYQAVSNWERGESMPDSVKLEDIKEVLPELLPLNHSEQMSLFPFWVERHWHSY